MYILNNFEYFAPETRSEALELAKKLGSKAKILAGGTDLIIQLKEKMITTENIINISGVDEFKGISCEPGKGAVIGACTKIADIEYSEALRKKYPALSFAAGEIGGPQVRSMATLGGNSCHSSPAAETPSPLSALGAIVVISSKSGDREVPIEEFILGNRKNVLAEGEIVTKFVLPEPAPKSANRYAYIGLRNAMEIDAVNMAVNLVLENDGETIKAIKLVMGSVFPRPLISEKIPALLIGKKLNDELVEQAAEVAQSEAKPITDVRASAEYRRDVVATLTRRLLKEAYAAAKEA
ncbi:MAG: aerobic-type carbon monoxide dehydrogenase, middle subunit CoxM/CutM-like protein [Firmicutes bacterium]|nr:aerobic-type carbon monoxide dehydrogenase, middle subunit CoxM/CutM-like protein [Bacillota bacterium]